MLELRNYIDGALVAPIAGKYLDNIEPATGKVYGRIPDSGAEDVARAAEAAERAFPGWAATSINERSAILTRIADLIQDRLEDGKTIEKTA